MSAPGAFDAVVIEAVMVQQRAATAKVTQGTNSRGQLGWQDGHVRPVEQSVLQKVVAHAFLDRRKAASMAVSVHQPRHQQLRAVADDAGTGIFGRDCGERSRFPDLAVRNHNSAGLDHTRCSEAWIGDYICAPHDDGLGHSLAHPCNQLARGREPGRASSARTDLYEVLRKKSPGTACRSWPFARGAEARFLRRRVTHTKIAKRGAVRLHAGLAARHKAQILQPIDRQMRKGVVNHQVVDVVVRDAGSPNIRVDAFVVRPVFPKPGVFDDYSDPGQAFWGIYSVMPVRPVPGLSADLYYLGL